MSDVTTRNLTIMFTDMKGFTSSTAIKSRDDLARLLNNHDTVLRPIFTEFKGTVVKTIGDAFLVIFDSPTNAVLCGLKIQDVVKEYNIHAEATDRFIVRVAINSGEVHIKENDVFGEPVNIAARIEGVADGGEVCFSEAVYLAMNKNETPPVISLGFHDLKGIPYQVKVYKAVSSHAELQKLLEKKSIRPAKHTIQPTHSVPTVKHTVVEKPVPKPQPRPVIHKPKHPAFIQHPADRHQPTTHAVVHYHQAPPIQVSTEPQRPGFLRTFMVYGVMMMVIFAIYNWINLTNPSFFPNLFAALDIYGRPLFAFLAHILDLTIAAMKQSP